DGAHPALPSFPTRRSSDLVGPGPRALQHWALAKSAGLKTVAKVQFNNTWELSAIPWIPALDLIAQHAANLAKVDIDGYMLSWTRSEEHTSELQSRENLVCR